jgi:two-component system chemotaxis response regulator CheY
VKKDAKVLIVDDSIAVLSMMDNMLTEFGFTEITKAENGLLAVEEFQASVLKGAPYGLVFLDIVMPVMDGQNALKRIRAIEAEAGITGDKKATIIMVTSLHSPNDMINALIDGDCSDYLIKPFDPDDLQGMLTKCGYLEPVAG